MGGDEQTWNGFVAWAFLSVRLIGTFLPIYGRALDTEVTAPQCNPIQFPRFLNLSSKICSKISLEIWIKFSSVYWSKWRRISDNPIAPKCRLLLGSPLCSSLATLEGWICGLGWREPRVRQSWLYNQVLLLGHATWATMQHCHRFCSDQLGRRGNDMLTPEDSTTILTSLSFGSENWSQKGFLSLEILTGVC